MPHKTRESKLAYHRAWLKRQPKGYRKEYAKKYRAQHPELYKASLQKHNKKLKTEAYWILGNKCAGLDCKWDVDGCRDERCLQIDHVFGNGNIERKAGIRVRATYKKVIATSGEGYQLLCANCNWIKRTVNKEY